MTFDLNKIEAGKLAYRQRLAKLPFGEKLQMLDQMRARDVWLRSARPTADATGTTPHPPSKSDR